MPRTRDFLLIGVVVGFLLIAISGTIMVRSDIGRTADTPDLQALPERGDEVVATTAPQAETLSRAERLAAMRQKVAATADISLRAPESTEPVATSSDATDEDADTATDSPEVVAAPQLCPGYRAYAGLWNPVGVDFAIRDGVRVVERAVGGTNQTAGSSSSASEVLVTLPVRSLPNSATSCLPSDVVAIAQDGSLVRNNEVGLYSVFGAETLIGYALDGFPIYGVSNIAVDTCGGAVVNGQYGYYLSDDRETIVNCFAGSPASL